MKTGLGKTVAFDLFSAGLHFSIILGRSPDLQAESISRFQVSPPSPDKAEWHIGETSPAHSGGTAPVLHRLPYYVLADTLDLCETSIAGGHAVMCLSFVSFAICRSFRLQNPTTSIILTSSVGGFRELDLGRNDVHAQDERG
jgi:hypothetical protein